MYKCRTCHGPVDESDDAFSVLLNAGLFKEAMEFFGMGQHLQPHPEYNCRGEPNTLALLASYEPRTSGIGDCQ